MGKKWKRWRGIWTLRELSWWTRVQRKVRLVGRQHRARRRQLYR